MILLNGARGGLLVNYWAQNFSQIDASCFYFWMFLNSMNHPKYPPKWSMFTIFQYVFEYFPSKIVTSKFCKKSSCPQSPRTSPGLTSLRLHPWDFPDGEVWSFHFLKIICTPRESAFVSMVMRPRRLSKFRFFSGEWSWGFGEGFLKIDLTYPKAKLPLKSSTCSWNRGLLDD